MYPSKLYHYFKGKEKEDVTIANMKCSPLCFDKVLRDQFFRAA